MMSFIGKITADVGTLEKTASSVAIAALRATSVPETQRIGDTLAAHVAARGLDHETVEFIRRLIDPLQGPQVSRVQQALSHIAGALFVANSFTDCWADDFDDGDRVYFETGVRNVYQAARLVAQIESLAKHQPPAGSRGSRKGHG